MSFIVPIPPNPDDAQYKGNPLVYNRAMYDWTLKSKGKLEGSKSLANGIPIQSPVPGDMPYYANNLGWSRLVGGTAGQILTYGTGTAPIWGNINSNLVAGSNVTITGTSTVTIAVSNAPPSGTAGGYLSGTYPNPNVAKVLGVSTNSNAAAGDAGEYIEQVIVSGSAISLTTGVTVNVTTISLTAGDWDVVVLGDFKGGATTVVLDAFVGLSLVSATFGAEGTYNRFTTTGPGATIFANSFNLALMTVPYRLSLSATTTVYFIAYGGFTTSTMSAFGTIRARRIR